MPTTQDYNKYGEDLERLLVLRYSPIAIKLLTNEDRVPEGAIRPKRDLGEHFALCQAFAMVRRQRVSIAMFKEDHWCVWPLISFGLVEFREGEEYYEKTVTANFIEDPQKAKEFFKKYYPLLEYGKYTGMVMAPVSTANFEPDLVLVYLKPAQLRSILMAVKYKTGEMLDCQLDSVDSCVHSTVPLIKDGKYRVTVPDPGEYERGLTDEDEMIFSVPGNKLEELLDGMNLIAKRGFGYRQLAMEMKFDFPRPQFYDDLFKMWGLDQGEIWKRK